MLLRYKLVPFVIVAVLAGVGLGAGAYSALAPENTTRTVVREVAGEPVVATSETGSVNAVYRGARDGVVQITVSQGADETPFNSQQQRGQGSGFVYDKRGHVITNHHVVDDASSITVTLRDGTRHSARLVGSDASTDLAVIRIDVAAEKLHPLALGSSSRLRVGENVVAIGSPFGLSGTVTTGVVSALDREMPSTNGFSIDGTIQTDAAINHGNSGGPLLNLTGQVIGVNAQIRSESGGSDGVGFAIPSDTVRNITSRLISGGRVEHAYLGVSAQTIDFAAAEALDVPQGAMVTVVRDGTPAERADLRAATGTKIVQGEQYSTGGDVITELGGREINGADELRNAIDARRPGETVDLTFTRDGETHTVKIKLAERPS